MQARALPRPPKGYLRAILTACRAEIARRRGAQPRVDDNPETLRKRISEYERNKATTLKVKANRSVFSQQGMVMASVCTQVLSGFMRLASVNGEPSKQVVHDAIAKAMHNER